MKAKLIGAVLAVGFLLAAAPQARAQFYYGTSLYPSGYYGPYPGYYTAYGAPAYHAPIYPAASFYGSAFYGAPSLPYPAYFGGYGYTYSYFTHVPGYSFTYYRGVLPRYAPGPYGAFYGYYGFGPYGW